MFFADEAIAKRLAGKRTKKESKKWIVYPDDRFRAYWDMVITA